jgi:hypothetical protein
MIFENQADYISVTGLMIVFVGYLLSFLILISYIRTRSPGTIGLGITIFGATSSWLSGSIAFIVYVITGDVIADDIYMYLFLWGIGIALPGIVFVTINILKQEHTKYWFTLTVLLSLAYLSEVYILLPFTDIVGQNDVVKIIYLEGSGLQESALVGFPLLFAFILIMTGFLFGILLLRYGIASSLPEIKIRGFFMGIGLMIFAFFSILDAAFNNTPENFIILVFARIMISFGLVLLTMGLIAPNFIKNKFTKT